MSTRHVRPAQRRIMLRAAGASDGQTETAPREFMAVRALAAAGFVEAVSFDAGKRGQCTLTEKGRAWVANFRSPKPCCKTPELGGAV